VTSNQRTATHTATYKSHKSQEYDSAFKRTNSVTLQLQLVDTEKTTQLILSNYNLVSDYKTPNLAHSTIDTPHVTQIN
jgi:hypothetical protein